MESKAINLNGLQARSLESEKAPSGMTLNDVFAERKGSYLNEFTLFLAHFNSIPNFINEIKIDCKKANIWFAGTFKTEIKDLNFLKRYFNRSKKAEYDDIFYILYDDLIVNFDTNNSIVRFLFRKTEIIKVEAIIEQIKKFRQRKAKRKPEISLLVNTVNGIDTRSFHLATI